MSKKIIQILLIILLVTLTIGITTSYATDSTPFVVQNTTSPSEMAAQLDAGRSLSILHSVKDANRYIYCRQYSVHLPNSGAIYTKDGEPIDYPNGSTYGDAIAYVLSQTQTRTSTTYTIADIQTAYWRLLDENEGKSSPISTNSLYNISKVYQTYKNSRRQRGLVKNGVILNKDEAKLNIQEDNQLIYGPITINYCYNIESDTGTVFGGFNYKFTDKDNNVLNNVKLCVLNKDTGDYTEIQYSNGSNGYKNVRTSSYNNYQLYIKANNIVGRVKLLIQGNDLDVTAKVYNIKGRFHVNTPYIAYCSLCSSRMKSNWSYSDLSYGDVVFINGNRYIYTGSTKVSGNQIADDCEYLPNQVYVNGSSYTTTGSVKCDGYMIFATTYGTYIAAFNNYRDTIIDQIITNHYSTGTNVYSATYCTSCGGVISSTPDDYSAARAHVRDHHMNTRNIHSIWNNSITRYNFRTYSCSSPGCGQYIEKGDHDSQNLSIVSASTYRPETPSLEIDIPLVRPLKIDLEKYNSMNENMVAQYNSKFSTNAATRDSINLPITELTNKAEFKIRAKQEGKDLNIVEESKNCFVIYPQSLERIYVVIEEKTPPDGYRAMQAKICAFFNFSQKENGNTSWNANFRPSRNKDNTGVDEWAGSGFNEFYQWIYDENYDNEKDKDGNTYGFPNPYYSEGYDDKIIVADDKAGEAAHLVIKVFNEAIIEQLTLYKVDEDNEDAIIKGAEFKATFENVKSFKYNGTVYSGTEDIPPFPLDSGKITLYDIVYEDEYEYDATTKQFLTDENDNFIPKPIKITLSEEVKPTEDKDGRWYYKELSGNIVIEIKHTPKDGLQKQGVGISYSGGEKMQLILNGYLKELQYSEADGNDAINNGHTKRVDYNNAENRIDDKYTAAIVVSNWRLVDIEGIVWLDGATIVNNKTNGNVNGQKESTEGGVKDVMVHLRYPADNYTNNPLDTRVTGEDGKYSFIAKRYKKDGYRIQFEYDGINFEDTNYATQRIANRIYSDALEVDDDRTNFNNKFTTIRKNTAVGTDGKTTSLEYDTSVKHESHLITKGNRTINGAEYNVVLAKFAMKANSVNVVRYTNLSLNCGLKNRVLDLSLANNVEDVKLTINDRVITTEYNAETKRVTAGHFWTTNEVEYPLKISRADYKYRIRNYIKHEDEFINLDDDVNSIDDADLDYLKIHVKYKVELINTRITDSGNHDLQGTASINQFKYYYDSRYVFNEGLTREANGDRLSGCTITNNNHILTFTFNSNKPTPAAGEAPAYYIIFELPVENISENDANNYYNAAEITSYSTNTGLIDRDSAPDNLDRGVNPNNSTEYVAKINQGNFEDDSCEARGVSVVVKTNKRKISGYVWEDANKNGKYDEGEQKIDGVIVQLIELKKQSEIYNNPERQGYYEYIWQETVSGTNEVKALTFEGDPAKYSINNDSSDSTGKYEFYDHTRTLTYADDEPEFEGKNLQNIVGFIPGNYIVRFIYGDGTVVNTDLNGDVINADLEGSIIKYNGQDYQSTYDRAYNKETYNASDYGNDAEIASTARDNEARRLETMEYAVDVDNEKGVLLKLLDTKTNEDGKLVGVTVDDLNARERRILADLDFPDIENGGKITISDVTKLEEQKDTFNNKINALRKEVLKNTWMCAETSTMVIPIPNPDPYITGAFELNYFNADMQFGLIERAKQTIDVKKYITGFKITASNGQTIVDATVGLDHYLNDPSTIGNFIEGIKNNLQIIPDRTDAEPTRFRYEAGNPTELNTILEGSKLEYKYSVIVKNDSEENYLSNQLITDYTNASSPEDYTNKLETYANSIKADMKAGNYSPGSYLGAYYYTGRSNGQSLTKLESRNIYDYISNELKVVSADYKSGGTVNRIEDSTEELYFLNPDYTISKIPIKTLLDVAAPDGKFTKDDGYQELYSVVLTPKNLISAGGSKEFYNYIAEVMAYTNAAGRRTSYTSTATDQSASVSPGNAEVVNEEFRPGMEHEQDEADTLKVEIAVETGEDRGTIYIWMGAILAFAIVIGIGTFVIKRRIVKK